MERNVAAKQLSFYADQGNTKGARRLLLKVKEGDTVPFLHYYNANKLCRNALMLASESGNASIVRLLLQEGVDVNRIDRIGCTAMMLASRQGHVEVINSLLESGVNVNQTDSIYMSTSLSLASEGGHKEAIALLLAHHALRNSVGKYGSTALSAARAAGRGNIVALLLDAGATDSNLDLKDEETAA